MHVHAWMPPKVSHNLRFFGILGGLLGGGSSGNSVSVVVVLSTAVVGMVDLCGGKGQSPTRW